ncbi:Caffeyl-CoA reductase-Etf complex subunit CarE [Caprobacter fermentans]|uniref:Caffeyl-CoA reductase-Etf complex subunit CarE n=1 Tax=Caproicibacter fermentans TaxID=2576756 RepID=A0A6N8HVM8_9FIRM|nr:4Fe-4S binding protein [Caproicibacter fermentans]MVB09851.1 Caffeyl-CoA reductase-Etf complex subunit CarE [Caproicibacter fermentans]
MAAKVNEKCVGCGSCESACPVEAIKVENGMAKVSDDCIECGACVSECPVEAISI